MPSPTQPPQSTPDPASIPTTAAEPINREESFWDLFIRWLLSFIEYWRRGFYQLSVRPHYLYFQQASN
jgi:hypothetical protein